MAKYTTTTSCQVCDKEFTTDKYTPRKTCSKECRSVLSKKNGQEQSLRAAEESGRLKECVRCKKPFQVPAQNNSTQKYCTKECYHKHTTELAGEQKVCPVCETEFWDYKKFPKTCCSTQCASKHEPFVTERRTVVMEKRKETLLERYGVDNYSKVHLSDTTQEVLLSKESFESYLKSWGRKMTTTEIARDLGCSDWPPYERVEEWGLWEYIARRHSTPELEIKDLLSSWGIETVPSRKALGNKQEVDLYSDEHKIGIEFNGDYWHSESVRGEDYHRNKSQTAEGRGVFLFHVFEYQWDNPRTKGRLIGQLRNLFGLNSRSFGARECEVREIEASQKNQFLEENHVQGEDRSRIKLGLFHKGSDELVAVMTFTPPRFSRGYEWELSRYCGLEGANISGGAQKLFKYFRENYSPQSILSYSDASRTRGTLYEHLGFTFKEWTRPNYVWTNSRTVKTRYQTQMRKERETMESLGYWRVFDCGSKRWVWENPDTIPTTH